GRRGASLAPRLAMRELRRSGGTRNHPSPSWPESAFCRSGETRRQDIRQEVRSRPTWCLKGSVQAPMMWLSALLLAGTLSGTPAMPVQSSMPQACFVFGEVFWSTTQINAMLSSNCAIRIERKERRIIMTGPNRIIEVLIPEDPGLHEFSYRWGTHTAQFDDESVEIVKILDGA